MVGLGVIFLFVIFILWLVCCVVSFFAYFFKVDQRSFFDEFAFVVDGNIVIHDFDKFMEKHRKDEWGDHLQIVAATELYNRVVHIWELDSIQSGNRNIKKKTWSSLQLFC